MVRKADHYVIEREFMVAFHLRSSAPYFYPDWEGGAVRLLPIPIG
jgi:hypothetical protein